MATAPSYPSECKVFIDDIDCTYWLFGADTISPTELQNSWRKVDISQYVRGAGLHKLKVTATNGVGRIDARVELS